MTRSRPLLALSITSVVLVLGLWYLATEVLALAPPLLAPSPVTVVERFIWLLGNEYQGASLLEHLMSSLGVVLVGWIVAVILGVALGFAFAWSPVLRDYADPLFQLIRPIPPIAWIPFALLWFGISPNARIFVVAIAAFAPCVINTYEALRAVDRSVLFAARSAGASRARTMLEIAFPTALPKVVVGIQIALGSAWMTLVAAELLAAQSGVGYMMQIARTSFQADVILVGMILIGAIGMLMSTVLRLIADRVIVWEKRA